MKLASLINLKSLKEEYSSEYIEGDKVKFNPLLMKDRGFEDNLEHYDDLTGVVTKTSQGELEVKLSKSIIPPGGGNIDGILLMKSEGDYEMIEKVEPGAFWDVQSGGELKEDLSRASIEELEALARQAQDIQDSEAGYAQQQGDFDSDKFGNEFADQKVMPYGGEYYSMNDIQDAIAKYHDKRGDVPYDVAIGRMTQDEYDEYMSTVKPDRASFEKSSKFDRINETTEKSWNAVDVSRKAEKEISNKEWNERTTKKLDMLKALNSAGKFKKDFDDERLQGWVDQNYSWEKLSRQFKLNEGSCGYGPDGVPGNTPGGTQGIDADDRTQGMLRKLIQREVKKLSKESKEGPDHGKTRTSPSGTKFKVWDKDTDMMGNPRGTKRKDKNMQGGPLRKGNVGYRDDMDENFDDRLKSMMGKDDFEKATSKDVPGLGDTVIDDKTNISTGRKTFMKMMMQFTDEPFLIETGLKLYDAWARGEGGLKPSRILKILQDTRN